jgi:two-component system C4-dicarboxylate transport sensor histidine kinase DctB
VIIGVGTIVFRILEDYGLYTSNKAWKNTPFRLDDAIEYAVVFILIAGVSWLSNREIFKSLEVAKTSKRELQVERDQLEIKVEERTRELHSAQVDKINSMYQLVEFGRISSGLFHDLMTPLNTLSFSISNISKERQLSDIQQVENQLNQCIKSSNRITDFISLAKKQIHHTGDESRFEICKEVESVVSLLLTKARHRNVDIKYNCQKRIYTYGSPTIFSHIITNLISNAIDAYGHTDLYSPNTSRVNNAISRNVASGRKVLIYIRKKHKQIEIKVKDFGSGIPIEIQSKIFDPFFTTKSQHGCGIGLSASKHSLEKYFKGTISFVSSVSNASSALANSTLQQGTTFIVKIPLIHNNETQSIKIDSTQI